MSAVYLVDTSASQRVLDPEVRSRLRQFNRDGAVATCLPLLLDAGYSARNAADHAEIVERELSAKVLLAPDRAVVDTALRLQSALWADGKGRAVGVSDLQIAATAMQHSTPERPVTVVHYDADFDHIAAIAPELRAEWIVPRGTAD